MTGHGKDPAPKDAAAATQEPETEQQQNKPAAKKPMLRYVTHLHILTPTPPLTHRGTLKTCLTHPSNPHPLHWAPSPTLTHRALLTHPHPTLPLLTLTQLESPHPPSSTLPLLTLTHQDPPSESLALPPSPTILLLTLSSTHRVTVSRPSLTHSTHPHPAPCLTHCMAYAPSYPPRPPPPTARDEMFTLVLTITVRTVRQVRTPPHTELTGRRLRTTCVRFRSIPVYYCSTPVLTDSTPVDRDHDGSISVWADVHRTNRATSLKSMWPV